MRVGIHVAQISALIVLAMPTPAVSQDAGIARGTVVQGRFLSFVGRTDERSIPINWYSGDLSTPLLHNINVLMPDYAKYLANMPTFGGDGWGPCTPKRWHVRYGRLWACFYDLLDSPMENRSFYMMRFGWQTSEKGFVESGEQVDPKDKRWRPENGWSAERQWRRPESPLQRISEGRILWFARHRSRAPEFLEHDFLPRSDHSLDLFLLVDGTMKVWHYEFKPIWSDDRPTPSGALRRSHKWHGEWTECGEFPVPFHAPFHVTEIPDGVAFTTDSGKCYVAMENSGGIWECSVAWNDESRPFIAIVDLPDQSESYAFGKDFYSLLDAKPAPVPCYEVTSNRIDFGEPLRTSWQCAKVLYADGRITAQRDETPRPGPSDARQNPQ